MSTQNARDTHFFLAGWNGHMQNANATLHFQQTMEKAPPQEPPTTPAAGAPQAVLDSNWKARMLDGRPFDRDEMGFGEHPELPVLDEGMKPRAFFAALGVELTHTMAEDDLELDEQEAMNDAGNWNAWTPKPPSGDGWKLVAIFDTEDGTAAWWARDALSHQAQDVQRDAERYRSVRDGVKFGDRHLFIYTMKDGCGTKLLGLDADAAIDSAAIAASAAQGEAR